MSENLRKIEHVLNFRSDISPFLVHLTKKTDKDDTKSDYNNLKMILADQELRGSSLVSDARFRMSVTQEKLCKSLCAVCFTETPLNEIYCLMEIKNRNVNLEPYGLVFLKEKLMEKGVSPVVYINNMNGDKDTLIQALCSASIYQPVLSEGFLPLISIFGKKLTPIRSASRPEGFINFLWEREWRYPAAMGPFKFDLEDIFIGLCPDNEIPYFDKLIPNISFVDPRRNMKWYADKLIKARQRCNLKVSVV